MNHEYIFLGVIVGWLAHFFADLMEASMQKGSHVGILEFIRSRPYKLTLSCLGTFAGLMFLYPELARAADGGFVQFVIGTSLGLGYAGDSAFGKFSSMYNAALNRDVKSHPKD